MRSLQRRQFRKVSMAFRYCLFLLVAGAPIVSAAPHALDNRVGLHCVASCKTDWVEYTCPSAQGRLLGDLKCTRDAWLVPEVVSCG